MDPPPSTTLNNAQVLTNPEKGQLQDNYALASQRAYNGTAVYLAEQPVPAPAQDHLAQRFRAWLFRWTTLSILFFGVLLYTFVDTRSIVLAFRKVFPDPGVVLDDKIYFNRDCIEVVEWNHIDAPDGQDGYSHVARINMDLPVASDLLYFIGTGRLSHGVVRFVDSEAQGSDQASVEVTFLYNDSELLDNFKVCRLHKEESKNGVGMFSPLWANRPDNQSTVIVEVKLPRAAVIKTLETHLSDFLHDVGDFRDSVTFGTISLSSSQRPIIAKYLTANRTILNNWDSYIAGVFNSPHAINISTSNSYIEGEFNLSHDGLNSTPSHINLRTRNAHINARISLTSTADDQKNGSFDIVTRTLRAPLNIKFDSAPIDSHVVFKGETYSSPATATLPETFEGTFAVKAGYWDEAGVHVVNTEDPSGEGRQRSRYTSHYGSGRGRNEGRVFWGDAGTKKLGHAELSSDDSPADLYL